MTVTTKKRRRDQADDPKDTMSGAINQAIDLAMGEDPEVIYLGEDVEDPIGGVMKGTKGMSTKYGRERVRNTPISEQAIIGTAIGASLVGMRPIAEIMLMDFFAVCMDQVANHAAKLRYMSGGRTNVPITIRTAIGGGGQFGAQHSQSLEAWMMHIPGLKVIVPSTPAMPRACCIRPSSTTTLASTWKSGRCCSPGVPCRPGTSRSPSAWRT